MEDSHQENLISFTEENELRTVRLDFGRVPVNKKVVKAVRILNDNSEEEHYMVQRDAMTNPLGTAFFFDRYSWTLNANSSTISNIRYQPSLPCDKKFDYFGIVNEGNVLKIVVEGECTGPKAVSSIHELIIDSTAGQITKKRFKIMNDSDVRADFIFDVDERQNCFKIDPMEGCIAPRSYSYIVVTFVAEKEGHRVCYLPCLIHHQAPIMTLLHGCKGKHYSNDNVPTLIYPLQDKDGFKAYTQDSSNWRYKKKQRGISFDSDPISLSNNYLDFGKTVPGSFNYHLRSTLTTCFTNHSKMDIFIKWQKDVDGIFSFKPREARVTAGGSYLFEVRFDPEEENEFYCKEITALALWMSPNNSVAISSYLMLGSVRLMGHTFPPGSSCWVPQYKIPSTVLMPPCLPLSSCFTTFVIRRFGHLPLMFRFMPPDKTNFSLKPMLGVITRNYQVIVVEMFSEATNDLLYERWSVIFNGNPEYEVFLDLRGYAEDPCLSFSSSLVHFLPTHPGCERVEQVAVRNPTRHRLTYRFEELPRELSVDRTRGEIYSNEIVILNWIFRPSEEGDYDFSVACYITADLSSENCKSAAAELRFVGKSSTGLLLAIPKDLNFGKRVCDEISSLSFLLINPGPVEIPYELTLKHHNWPYEEKCAEEVKLNPSIGSVCPGKEENIEILLSPRQPGLHELTVHYSVRKIDQEVERTPLEICRIKYYCILPALKVEDLLAYRMPPNMSKYVLWRLLNINKFNRVLRDLQHGESTDLEVSLPPMIIQQEKSIIKFLVSNPTFTEASWSFKRVKLCCCLEDVDKRTRDSLNKCSCSHDDLCSVYPRSGSLKAREKTTITMELRYEFVGETWIQWDLDLGHDRRVCLCMKMICLSGNEDSAMLLYGSRIGLKKVYIGDRDPINQICWIYNPTNNDTDYSVDTKVFKKMNDLHRCEIISCLNPSGIVKALSHEAIFINFRPRQWGEFVLRVPLTLGSGKSAITIRGEATGEPWAKISQEMSPLRDILRLPELPIYFNTDHVTLSPTSTHSRLTRLIMVHNRAKSDVIAYEWRRYELPGVLTLEVEPSKARIPPGTLRTHRLIVRTGGKPCRINADVVCELINQSEMRAHAKSVLLYNGLCEEMKDHFVITEKGTTVPKPEKNFSERPKPFYKTLTVRSFIYSPQDERLKTRRKDKLKNTPPLEISLSIESEKISAGEEAVSLCKFILEGMIWNILESTDLCALPKNDIKYSQMAMSPLQRKKIQDRSYVTPSGRTLDKILENMIFTIVHKEFALDVIHLSQTSDARQVAHHKMWQHATPGKGLEGSPDF